MDLKIWGIKWRLIGDERDMGSWENGWIDPEAHEMHIYKTERMIDVAYEIFRLFATISRLDMKAPSWRHVSMRLAMKHLFNQIEDNKGAIAQEMGVVCYGYEDRD